MQQKNIILLLFSILLMNRAFTQIDTSTIHFNTKSKSYTHKPKGYFGRVELDVNLMPFIFQNHAITVVNGYKFHKYAQLGLGVGFNTNLTLMYHESSVYTTVVKGKSPGRFFLMMPIDVCYRGEVGKNKRRFYFGLNAGVYIPLNFTNNYEIIKTYSSSVEYEKNNYFYYHVNPTCGASFYKNSRFVFSVGGDLNLFLGTGKTTLIRSSGTTTNNSTIILPTMGLKLGFGW